MSKSPFDHGGNPLHPNFGSKQQGQPDQSGQPETNPEAIPETVYAEAVSAQPFPAQAVHDQAIPTQPFAAKPSDSSNSKWLLGCLAAFAVFSLLSIMGLGFVVVYLLAKQDTLADAAPTPSPSPPFAPTLVESDEQPITTLSPGTNDSAGASTSASTDTGTNNAEENTKLRPLEPLDKVEISRSGVSQRYDWKKIGKFAAEFGFSTRLADRQNISVRGKTVYTYSTSSAASLMKGQEIEAGESTGTGFLVHPDGAILTCAHVVGSAEEIEVIIGSETLTGKVIATDQALDLAIVRIAVGSNSKPYLQFAPAGDVKQGSGVQVLGFPLTDSLGESLKINAGSISGFGGRDSGQAIQLDATVNPGNSGGPVVDRNGRVVGVADAMLSGGGINPIGFAIQGKEAVAFLAKHNVDTSVNTSATDGRGGIDSVKKSVVLLKAAAQDASSAIVLNFHTNWYGDATGYGNSERGKTVVDPFGRVLYTTGKKSMPLLNRPFGTLGIEMLPPSGADQWQDSQMMIVEKTERTESRSQRGPRGLPRYSRGIDIYGGQREIKEKTYQIPIVQATQHKTESADDKKISISKKYQTMAANEDSAEKYPGVRMEGTYSYSVPAGNAISGSFKGTTEIVDGNTSINIPFTYGFDVRDAKAVEREEKASRDRIAENQRKEKEKQAAIAKITVRRLDQYDPEK